MVKIYVEGGGDHNSSLVREARAGFICYSRSN
jgi:hypothetical protein